MKKVLFVLFVSVISFVSGRAWAGPFYINAPLPDGNYMTYELDYLRFDELTDGDGNKAADVDAEGALFKFDWTGYFHVAEYPVLAEVILPTGYLEETELFGERSKGLGDLQVGGAFWFYANEETRTYLSYWFYVTAPIGEWDPEKTINLGTHNWTFDHLLGLNQTVGPWALDVTLWYQHSTEEPDTDTQAPDRFLFDGSLGYQFSPSATGGIAWTADWALEDMEIGGDAVSDSKDSKIQAGPQFSTWLNDRFLINLTWLHDIKAENTFKGDVVVIQFSTVL